MLGSLPPAARKALAAALVLLDQGARLYPPSRGRRFARLDDRVAGAYIRALLARHGVAAEMIRRLKSVVTMCYYELPEVQREIGYEPAPYIAAVSRRRLESYGPQIRAAQADSGRGLAPGGTLGQASRDLPSGLTGQDEVTGDLTLECGAVIVGSGAGGATVAAELAEAGVDVIVLEEGGYHPTESFTAGTGRALRTLYRDGGGGMAIGHPSVLYAEGRCVGGSTVVNGGMSWRTPARVLRRWAEQEGLRAISEQGPRPLLRHDRVPAFRRTAGPGDDRAGFRAVQGRRRGQGLDRGPEPQEPAALRGHQQLQQRLPDRRETVDAGDQRAPGAGARRPAARRLPGGPDHPVRARGDRRDRPLRPPGRPPGPEPDRTGPGGDRGRRRGADAGPAHAVGPAVGLGAARPEPVGAPERGGDRVLRPGRHRLAGRSPGLPGARIPRRRAAADRDQPHSPDAGRDLACLRPRTRRADGGLQPHRHRGAAGLRHRDRPDPERPRPRAAGLLPAHRPRRRPRAARRGADRRGAVHRRRPARAAPLRRRPRGPRARTNCAGCWPGRYPNGPSSCSRST